LKIPGLTPIGLPFVTVKPNAVAKELGTSRLEAMVDCKVAKKPAKNLHCLFISGSEDANSVDAVKPAILSRGIKIPADAAVPAVSK
jgi:hypothetical protein